MIKVFIKNQDNKFLKKFNPFMGNFEFVSNLKDASIFGKVEANEIVKTASRCISDNLTIIKVGDFKDA